MKLYSLTEVSKELGLTRPRIWQLIKQNKIKAEKIGNTYVIWEDEVKRVKLERA